MTKVTDFRIGNIVLQNGNITIIDSLERSLNDWERTNHKRTMDTEPIPIDKQWLQKFGFINQKYEHFFLEVNGFSIEFDILKGSVYHSFLEGRTINIHYVHELQNLYFSLTGKELSVS
jgi:hypothetical protein